MSIVVGGLIASYSVSYAGSGNRCGHDPKKPQLELAQPAFKGLGGLPRILTLAQERLEHIYTNPLLLPGLHHPNRKIRSERLEACVIVGKALLKRMDLGTLCCGLPTPNKGFIDIDMKTIVLDSGIGQRRCERAIRVFKEAGLVTVKQPRRQNAEGKYFGCRAIRAISKNLFTWLGLNKILATERKKAMVRLKTLASSERLTIGDLVRRPFERHSRKRGGLFPSSHAQQDQLRRDWGNKIVEIMNRYPNLNADQWREKANQALNLPPDFTTATM